MYTVHFAVEVADENGEYCTYTRTGALPFVPVTEQHFEFGAGALRPGLQLPFAAAEVYWRMADRSFFVRLDCPAVLGRVKKGHVVYYMKQLGFTPQHPLDPIPTC